MIMSQEAGEFAVEMWDPNWVCGLTDGDESREVKLAAFIEFIDRADYDSEIDDDEKYRYIVDVHIVAHPDSLTEDGKRYAMCDGADQVYISDLHHNCGGVPVKLDWCRSMNEDWNGIDYKEENGDYYFASWDDADKFVDRILKTRLSGVMGMIGFLLDEPINRIGSSGWDMIESMVYGKSFVENAFARMAKQV